MNRKTKTFLAFGLSTLLTAGAIAQEAPPVNNTLTPRGGRDQRREQSAAKQDQPPPQPQNVPYGRIVQESHGSLAQAAELVNNDPSSPPPSTYSYYSVPEPKPKVIKKHDLITIVVNENSAFSSNGTTDLQHHADVDAQIDAYLQLRLDKLHLVAQAPQTPLELKGSGDRNFKGTAQVDRSDTLTARITAEVLDVKPNGNLVLQATKKIKTDDEEQSFVLVGTCRAEDVTPDNTVLSSQLYSLELTKNHKGAVRDTTKRGFVMSLLDWINPF